MKQGFDENLTSVRSSAQRAGGSELGVGMAFPSALHAPSSGNDSLAHPPAQRCSHGWDAASGDTKCHLSTGLVKLGLQMEQLPGAIHCQ